MSAPNPVTRYHPALGHVVRADPWPKQGLSSYGLAAEALRERRVDDAVALAKLTVQEAQEAFDLYYVWLDLLPRLLTDRGVRESSMAPARLLTSRTRENLAAGWTRYNVLIGQFVDRARSQGTGLDLLEAARTCWLAAHDPATDRLAALFALASDELGEASIGALWDALLGTYYARIPDTYDPSIHPWSTSVDRLGMDIFEAVRGHLTGPGRDGRFDVREDEDRWVLQFAPCGSGGRTYPTAEDEGRDAREFTVDKHDWAWRTTGVCLYCVHCCQLQQRVPIEAIGIPLRVIEPPVRAAVGQPGRGVCRWSIYKDPSKIPDHAYTDVGAVPPTPNSKRPDTDKPIRPAPL